MIMKKFVINYMQDKKLLQLHLVISNIDRETMKPELTLDYFIVKNSFIIFEVLGLW